jgi:hypothetical protein
MKSLAVGGIQEFGAFVDELESFIRSILRRGYLSDSDREPVSAALDGQAGAALRRLVGVVERRNAGAFFTGSAMASSLIAPHETLIKQGGVVADPACGAGDLLIACATRMAVEPTLSRTVEKWGHHLYGSDIEPVFIRATILRLLLEAIRRTPKIDCTDVDRLASRFYRVREEDGLTAVRDDVRLIVLNPPYGLAPAPPDCKWAAGATARAALFYESVLVTAPDACRIVSILPDVLRTGRRYEKWRSRVAELATIASIHPGGVFDQWTDVDVFELDVLRKTDQVQSHVEWWDTTAGATLSDRYKVSVGSVVPFRDPHAGPVYPYVHPRNLQPWREVTPGEEVRSYSGPVVQPPFVAIRRTSRPGDRHRAVASIVTGASGVAVENHLIVCKPHDASLKSCRALVERLRNESTTRWLDERLRCRHLTVTAIRELPWQDD